MNPPTKPPAKPDCGAIDALLKEAISVKSPKVYHGQPLYATLANAPADLRRRLAAAIYPEGVQERRRELRAIERDDRDARAYAATFAAQTERGLDPNEM